MSDDDNTPTPLRKIQPTGQRLSTSWAVSYLKKGTLSEVQTMALSRSVGNGSDVADDER
jgi:hypothetical protein